MQRETGFQPTETANTFRGLDLAGLSPEQVNIVKDYMSPHEGKDYYSPHASFILDYLRHPEQYRPTEFAYRSAYCDFVVRRFDEGKLPGRDYTVLFPTEISYDEIDFDRLQNVQVSLEYGYSSTLGKNSAVKELTAQARKDTDSAWEDMRSGGVAFSLEDWVEKIPEDSQAK
ncbi:hypothetical protein JW887_00125 [Candidatus Dojkabacteria bacterium]|nr:hypothetical protein [Candidatus Dojkabacteria bacterium]